jgi:hypothetical protein
MRIPSSNRAKLEPSGAGAMINATLEKQMA